MDNKTLNSKLKQRAVQLGLCTQWTSEWESEESQDMLVKKYKRGIDFCIENNYPNNEFIKANFSRDVLLNNLVFVDESINIDGVSGIYVINGSTVGTIIFRGYSVGTLYRRHNSNIKVICEDMSKVFITLLDSASLDISQQDAAKCYVYQRSNKCTTTHCGDVLIRK